MPLQMPATTAPSSLRSSFGSGRGRVVDPPSAGTPRAVISAAIVRPVLAPLLPPDAQLAASNEGVDHEPPLGVVEARIDHSSTHVASVFVAPEDAGVTPFDLAREVDRHAGRQDDVELAEAEVGLDPRLARGDLEVREVELEV